MVSLIVFEWNCSEEICGDWSSLLYSSQESENECFLDVEFRPSSMSCGIEDSCSSKYKELATSPGSEGALLYQRNVKADIQSR